MSKIHTVSLIIVQFSIWNHCWKAQNLSFLPKISNAILLMCPYWADYCITAKITQNFEIQCILRGNRIPSNPCLSPMGFCLREYGTTAFMQLLCCSFHSPFGQKFIMWHHDVIHDVMWCLCLEPHFPGMQHYILYWKTDMPSLKISYTMYTDKGFL